MGDGGRSWSAQAGFHPLLEFLHLREQQHSTWGSLSLLQAAFQAAGLAGKRVPADWKSAQAAMEIAAQARAPALHGRHCILTKLSRTPVIQLLFATTRGEK